MKLIGSRIDVMLNFLDTSYNKGYVLNAVLKSYRVWFMELGKPMMLWMYFYVDWQWQQEWDDESGVASWRDADEEL